MLPITLLLAVLAFLARPAAGQYPPDSCVMVLPSLGDGENQVGVIPSGPRLLATGEAGNADYTYLVNTDTDALQLWTQSYPGIGTGTTYTRKVEMILSSRTETTYGAAVAAVHTSCEQVFAPFADFSSHAGTTISGSETDLTNSAEGTNAVCYFNHLWTMSYGTFRGSPANSCGFELGNDYSVENSTFKTLTGRVHVRWTDDTDTTDGGAPRAAMQTWYDVTLRIQSEANRTSADTGNVETPYNADFQVTGITYTKGNDNKVKASIAYTLSTRFPYYPSLGSANDVLVHSGTPSSYAGNLLTTTANYPDALFTNTLSRDGTVVAGGTACDAVGETCVMTGVLDYEWTPTDSATTSCQISSSTAYQFDFVLECNNDYNGTDLIAQSCGVDMRQALDLTSFGSFSLDGNLDFCKTAATDFPITWTDTFEAQDTLRAIGQTIVADGTFTSSKAIEAVGIKSYTVDRLNFGATTWQLWNGALASATSTGANADAYTTIGTNVNFQRTITASGDKKTYSIATWFTPNIKLNTAIGGSRTEHMILLPDDKAQTLTFRMTVALRIYSDTTQTFARRRRLMYRDEAVPMVPVNDVSLQTSEVDVRVPENVQVSTDGSVTVVSAPATLSVGAIAGIAAIGAAVAAAAIGLTVVIVRRRKQAAAEADAEQAMAQVHASTDFLVSGKSVKASTSGKVVA